MLPDDLRQFLAQRLDQPLPGREAHRKFAHELSFGRHSGPVPASARPAAVLIMLSWQIDDWLFPLTVRQQGLGTHAGQISLPGGGIEQGETHYAAALRECQEELGWAPRESDILGKLSPLYVYASNYVVTPVVAVSTDTPKWKPNPQEVAELFEMPVTRFLSAETSVMRIPRQKVVMNAPCFRWKSYSIWGATAMMLAELRAVLLNA